MPSSLSVRLRRVLPRVRLTRRRIVAGSVVLIVIIGLVGWAVWPTPASYHTQDRMIPVRTGPAGDQTVRLDTRFYLPKAASPAHPVSAVLLAHGFGGRSEERRVGKECRSRW